MKKEKKKIVWFSRHEPLQSQLNELERLFGPYELVRDINPFASAEEVVIRFRQLGGDEMVVVAPLTVIMALCNAGLRPLKADMVKVDHEDPRGEITVAGKRYRFVGFSRVREVRVISEPVLPVRASKDK